MYDGYLNSGNAQIDVIVCEEPEKRYEGVEYEIVPKGLVPRLKDKFGYRGKNYTDALLRLIGNKDHYVIQFVDNFKMVKPISEALQEKGLRNRCHIQLFYHGFAPILPDGSPILNHIDEMVFLTRDSYKAHRDFYTVFPIRASVLHNGIDTEAFKKVSQDQKNKIRQELGLNRTGPVFFWCSQDRPKKGLDLLIDAWSVYFKNNPGSVLMIAGTKRQIDTPGIKVLGRIPNKELPKYYQAADCYLFPTLWKEGFGLSLIEALNCGCFCIASQAGGVPEVMHYGDWGLLIDEPHDVSRWVAAMEEFTSKGAATKNLKLPVYTKEDWNNSLNDIIVAAKRRFQIN